MLVSLSIAADKNESRSMVLSQIEAKNFLNFDDFLKIFAKSMLKGAVLGLSKKVQNSKIIEKEIPDGLKIPTYKRASIMSGVQCPNSEITENEGIQTLNDIKTYQISNKTFEK